MKITIINPYPIEEGLDIKTGIIGGTQTRASIIRDEFERLSVELVVLTLGVGLNEPYRFRDYRTKEGKNRGYKQMTEYIERELPDRLCILLTRSAGFREQIKLISKFKAIIPVTVFTTIDNYSGYLRKNDIPILNSCKSIIVQQKNSAEYLLSLGIKESIIRIIPNPVDTCRFRPPAKASTRKALRILSTTRLTQTKGIDTLIQAIQLFDKKNIPYEFEIVGSEEKSGEGEFYTRLIQNCSKTISNGVINYRGRIPYQKMPEVYQSADIFVSCSIQEGLSNSLLEACSSGLPIIATDIEVNQSVAKKDKNALIFQIGNAEELADCLEILSKAPSLRENLSKSGVEIAKNFDSKIIAKRYLDEIT